MSTISNRNMYKMEVESKDGMIANLDILMTTREINVYKWLAAKQT